MAWTVAGRVPQVDGALAAGDRSGCMLQRLKGGFLVVPLTQHHAQQMSASLHAYRQFFE